MGPQAVPYRAQQAATERDPPDGQVPLTRRTVVTVPSRLSKWKRSAARESLLVDSGH